MFNGAEAAANGARQVESLIDHEACHLLPIVSSADVQLLFHMELVSCVFHDSLNEEDNSMNRARIIAGKREGQVVGLTGISGDALSWQQLGESAACSRIAV